jgi:hypothetical protein
MGQSRMTIERNWQYRQKKREGEKHTIWVGHHYAYTSILQTTGGKNKPDGLIIHIF